MKSSKTLIAGPWVGEFGWELFAWQAYIRSLSRKYENTIVVCRSGSKDLYADFADEFIFCDKRTGISDSYYMEAFDFKSEIKDIVLSNGLLQREGISICTPRRIGFPPFTHYSEAVAFGQQSIVPEYIKFSNESDLNFDYVIHARNRKLRQEDNWSSQSWDKLCDLLGGKIACIGSKDESLLIDGASDFRGSNLSVIFGLLNNAKCIFGPSSGPMHLASLCGTPHIVWSKSSNRDRYENTWNPLGTPVLFLSEHSWHPSPTYVYEKYLDWEST